MTEILPCPVLFSIGLWNTTLYLLVRVNRQRRSVCYRVHKHRHTELGMEKQTRPKSSQTSCYLGKTERKSRAVGMTSPCDGPQIVAATRAVGERHISPSSLSSSNSDLQLCIPKHAFRAIQMWTSPPIGIKEQHRI